MPRPIYDQSAVIFPRGITSHCKGLIMVDDCPRLWKSTGPKLVGFKPPEGGECWSPHWIGPEVKHTKH